ncbi:MAG: uroporphyrinogen-III synthase [Bacteroidota bacterium]|nr:uroporphyrinogen-III synthase [Bacteroidota bacterium]
MPAYGMPDTTIHILSTRPVSEEMREKASAENILLDTISFIETTPVTDIAVQQEIELASVQQASVVFTSMNAVEAVAGILDGYQPDWQIFCLGFKTRELVINYFGEASLAATASNASELADQILETDLTDEVIFFCGNKRREELPAKLRENKIEVTEIVVYETVENASVIDKPYQGILFFSPSAVESFFSANQTDPETLVFAIGQTTQQTVNRFCTNQVIVSEHPGKDQLVEQAIQYFVTHRNR